MSSQFEEALAVLLKWENVGPRLQKHIDAVLAQHILEVDKARLKRDREWSNRLESQDIVHPDSPDFDLAVAWYVRVALDKARAAGKREVARRVQNWIDGRTVGYPHGDLKDLRDWMQQWIGEEAKG